MIATLLSVASLCAVAPPVNSSEAPQTLLYVRTTPSGAQILLDGKPLGSSDGLFPVQPGQYQIVVDLEGHQPQKQEITVRDGRITRVELTLAKGPAAGSATPNSKPGKASDLSSGVSFGPWTEVPLKDRGEGLDEVFDLDTGKWGTMKSTGRIDGNTSREMRERGMDLLVRRLKESPPSMGKPEVWLFDAVRWEEPNGSSISTPEAIPMLMRLKPETSSLKSVGPGRTYYYYFKTREGAMGLLYVMGGMGMDFPAIRYRLVQKTGTQSPAPAPQPAVAGFGPAIERVVSDDRAGKNWFIDLDTGVLHTPPAGIDKQRKPQEMYDWARREGIDASGVKAGQGFLLGIDLQVAAIDGASWDDVDPARVASAMGDQPNTSVKDAKDQPPVMVGGAGRPASALYGFRTREGGMGVLQVIGVTADPKGLKIRYKLLQGTPQLAPRKVHLSGGPSSRPMVLDLASGETFNLPPAAEKDPKVLVLMGKGDLALDRGLLYCLRGARAVHIADDSGTEPLEIEDDESEKGVMIYRLPPVLPARLLVFTAEKKPFVVTILSAPQPPGLGGELEYRPAQRDPRDRGQPKETLIKSVHLAELETRDAEVVLDLASGQTLKISDRKSKEGLAQFARLGKGDLFFVRSGVRWSLACLRGATAMRWGDADRLVPLAADKHPDPREPVTSYELPQVPCRLRVSTPEKKQFDLTILAIAKDGGIDLQYRVATDPRAESPPTKNVHLPHAATLGAQVVLDLASGETLAPDRKEGVAGFARLGKGDVFFVQGPWGWSVGCLRRATATRWDGGQLAPVEELMVPGRMSAYKLRQVPCRLLVTTAEKKRFDLTILAITKDDGIDLEYRLAADMTTVPEPAKKVHLPDADTRGAQVVLDLASGQMLAPDRKEGVAGFARLGKGDLFFVRGPADWSLGCLRGAKATRWDGGQLAPLEEPMRPGMSAYKLPQVPCRLLVTAAEKTRFDVTILAVSKDGGIDLEYRRLAVDPTTVPEPKR